MGELVERWAALHHAAATVGGIAGIPAEPLSAASQSFPKAIAAAGSWRLEHAEQGVEDLSAIMEAGLAALLAALARGTDPSTAALALWCEFQAARDGLMALLPLPQ